MEKIARKYTVTFTVEETEARRLTVKMDAGPFLRTAHILSIAGCIMENISKCVEQHNVLKGD